MQAAVMYKPGDIRLEDVPKPEAKEGEVLLRVAAVGVCGSDIPRLLTKGAHRMPIICGHEFSGQIIDIGEGVSGFEIGELVGVAPLLPCRVCDQCVTGNFSRCRNYDYFGSRRDGAYAEFVATPVANLLKAPSGADPRAIAMTDPASIALHAVWKAPPTMGQRGAVVGCGPIGLFAIQWMRPAFPLRSISQRAWLLPAAMSCSSAFRSATFRSTTRLSSTSCVRRSRCTAHGIPSAHPFPERNGRSASPRWPTAH